MEKLDIAFYILFFIGGLVIGSFLEVVVYRVPRKLSIIKPGSYCPQCKKAIVFYDNLPVLSYLILKGRCRNCKARIPIRSLLVELFAGFLFVLNYFYFGIGINTAIGIILCSTLLAVSFIDIEFRIIPNLIVIPFALIGLLFNILRDLENWWHPLVFSTGAFLVMFIINLIYPRGMGMGDVKLSFMAGAFLVKNIIAGLFIGFLLGALYGIGLIIKNRKLGQTIPFGPFISAGSILALFWGNNILKWYTSFF